MTPIFPFAVVVDFEATYDERIEARGRLEQVASLDRALGDFDRGPWMG